MKKYLIHYTNIPQFPLFIFCAFAVLFFILFIVAFAAKKLTAREYENEKIPKKAVYKEFCSLSERFFELIFSGTSILLFLSSYYLIERFVTSGSAARIWNKYSDMLLLAFIVLSVIINSFLDHIFVPLRNIDKSKRASIRVVGMLYVIIIFMYIKFIYEDNNYDSFIMYFIGLMVGRFVYFDASFSDFLDIAREALKDIPLLFLSTAYIAAMSYIGFSTKYLLTHNGVIFNVFLAHVFMDVAIFVCYRTGIKKIFIR